MGKLHTVVAWLAVSTLGLVCVLPHVTLADDSGPGKEVRAIRHDLRVLVPGSSVTTVNVSGREASASWTVGIDPALQHFHGALEQHLGQWWLMSSAPDGNFTTPAAKSNEARFSGTTILTETLAGYRLSIAFAPNDAGPATLTDIQGRAPTEAESWLTRGGNSYFFFSGTIDTTAPIHVQSGTTIDVWFPFVLDTSLYYAITIAHADKPIGPIDGTLKDNVVHFVLPAFTLPPGATLMAEIEGDSFRHE